MLCTVDFIKGLFPNYSGMINNGSEIQSIMTDSRIKQRNALFVPIIGERFDGHDYVEQAIESGAIAVIWNKEYDIPSNLNDDILFFLVDDTLIAMQSLAKAYRKKVNPIVIGITGSNGKTTTKDLVNAVISEKYRTHATKGNFNNDIGLPITVLSMEPDTEVLILEMGMNHFHEIERLSKIAEPDYAVITNIGESHIEFLGSREGIAKAKLEIREGLHQDGILLMDGDESLLHHVKHDQQVVTCGFSKENKVTLSNIRLENKQTIFHYDQINEFHLPLLGEHHAKNASFAIWLGKHLQMTNEEIQTGFNKLTHTAMRFEWRDGKNGAVLINDAYNASYTSMKAAIDIIKKLEGFKRKIVVLGDILELGNYAKEMHQGIGKEITSPIDIVLTIGEDAKEISNMVQKESSSIICHHFQSHAALVNELQKYLTKDTIILFKASRRMQLEKCVEACL